MADVEYSRHKIDIEKMLPIAKLCGATCHVVHNASSVVANTTCANKAGMSRVSNQSSPSSVPQSHTCADFIDTTNSAPHTS
jgi:hypothetical protein